MPPLSSNDNRGLPSPWDWRPSGPSRLQRPVGLLQLQGPDSLRFLHGQTSQDLQLARPGQWLGTCCISPTARLRALAEVLVVEGGAWLVISEGDAPGRWVGGVGGRDGHRRRDRLVGDSDTR